MKIETIIRRKRLFIATGAFYLLIGVVALLAGKDFAFATNLNYRFIILLGLGSVFAGAGFLLLSYLRGDFESSEKKAIVRGEQWTELGIPVSISRDIQRMDSTIADLKVKILETEKSLPNLKELSTREREELVSKLKVQLESVLASNVVSQIEEKYSSKIANDAQVGQIRKGIEVTCQRLRDEIAALTRRGNLNLVIGTLTTVAAVGLLGYLVLGATINYTSVPDLLSHFIPRISIAIFIEVFSFFFLKLYKSSLQEIKYFQNELTNVEMRGVALEAALLTIHNKTTEPIVEQLMRTDRNLQSVSAIKSDGKEGTTLEPKDVANLLDKLAKLLNIGSHK
jgi:soluble cytochrome b562